MCILACNKLARRREIFTATSYLLTQMHANFDSKPLTVLVQSTQAQWSGCTAKVKAACELVVLDKVYESDQGCWIA